MTLTNGWKDVLSIARQMEGENTKGQQKTERKKLEYFRLQEGDNFIIMITEPIVKKVYTIPRKPYNLPLFQEKDGKEDLIMKKSREYRKQHKGNQEMLEKNPYDPFKSSKFGMRTIGICLVYDKRDEKVKVFEHGISTFTKILKAARRVDPFSNQETYLDINNYFINIEREQTGKRAHEVEYTVSLIDKELPPEWKSKMDDLRKEYTQETLENNCYLLKNFKYMEPKDVYDIIIRGKSFDDYMKEALNKSNTPTTDTDQKQTDDFKQQADEETYKKLSEDKTPWEDKSKEKQEGEKEEEFEAVEISKDDIANFLKS
jgi:hypothetical protein